MATMKQQIQWAGIRRNPQDRFEEIHWITGNFYAGADSSKHEVANGIKSVRIVQQLASDAVR